MEREIVLSSYSVENKGNNIPGNFITKFTRPIVLDNNHEYAIGLNRIINMRFTWFNVNVGYDNQLIRFAVIQELILQIYHFRQVYGIIVILIHTSNKRRL